MVAVVIGYVLMLVSRIFRLNEKAPKIEWASAKWLFPYLIGLGVISYFGGFGEGGIIGGVSSLQERPRRGRRRSSALLGRPRDHNLQLGLLCLAMASRLSAERVGEYTKDIWA